MCPDVDDQNGEGRCLTAARMRKSPLRCRGEKETEGERMVHAREQRGHNCTREPAELRRAAGVEGLRGRRRRGSAGPEEWRAREAQGGVVVGEVA